MVFVNLRYNAPVRNESQLHCILRQGLIADELVSHRFQSPDVLASPPAAMTAGAINVPGDSDAWVHAMRSGEFEVAWRINDADIELRKLSGRAKHAGPRHLQHIWDGTPLLGRRVLVRCYHGLGDTIQFCRFLVPLHELASQVIVWCQPALVDLIGRVEGVDLVLPLHDGTPSVEYDVDIEIMELAHALRVTRHDLARVPYVHVPQRTSARRLDRRSSDDRLAVGLAWKGGNWDVERSLPLAEVRRLCGEPDISFHSLHCDAEPSVMAQMAVDLETSPVDALLRTMYQLDLIISVDTMAAHLAGAAGLETWTLLIENCDWRWPREGSSTVWYPTMQLFHQQRPGDWESVLDRVVSGLRARKQMQVTAT